MDRIVSTQFDARLGRSYPQADLPVQAPTKFELVIDLKLRKRSASKFRRMQQLTDEVIE